MKKQYLFLFLILTYCTHVLGVTKTFARTTGSNLWALDSNWNPVGIPTSDDDVLITAVGTYTVVISSPQSVKSLSVGGADGTQTLQMNGGTFTIGAGGATINAFGVFVAYSGVLAGVGSMTVKGVAVYAQIGTKTIGINLTIAPGASISIDGGEILLANSVTFTISQGATALITSGEGISTSDSTPTHFKLSGSMTINPGNYYTASITPLFLADAASIININSGTFTVSNNATWRGQINTQMGTVLSPLSGYQVFESSSLVRGGGTIFVASSAGVLFLGTLIINNFSIGGGVAVVDTGAPTTFQSLSIYDGRLAGIQAVNADSFLWEGGSIDLQNNLTVNSAVFQSVVTKNISFTPFLIEKVGKFSQNIVTFRLFLGASFQIDSQAILLVDNPVYFFCDPSSGSNFQILGVVEVDNGGWIQVSCPLQIFQGGKISLNSGNTTFDIQGAFQTQSGTLQIAQNTNSLSKGEDIPSSTLPNQKSIIAVSDQKKVRIV